MEINLQKAKEFKGYLEKKSPSFFASWQKRFFFIFYDQLGATIFYSDKEGSKPKGQIKISDISPAKATEKRVFLFKLDERDFILRAETNELRDQWVNVINLLREDNLNQISRMSNVNQLPRSSVLQDNLEVIKHSTSFKSHKIQKVDKNTMEQLKAKGILKYEDEEKSLTLLNEKGISKLLNVNDPKIQCRIHYGFLFKKHKQYDYYQKSWFFIYSHRPLSNEKYFNDETNVDKKKEWLEFDRLYYFAYENENENDTSESKGYLDMVECHKVETSEEDAKFNLVIDCGDRKFYLYSNIKAIRDKWVEVINNSTITSREYKASITKHPRNVTLLNSKYIKGQDDFIKKMEEEKIQKIGDYKEIKEYNILDFTLNNLGDLIEETIDGCNASKKPELMEAYSEYMNTQYLIIVKKFWESQFDNLDSCNIVKLALKLFEFSRRLQRVHLIDLNFDKNGRKLIKIYMKKTYKNILDVIENILKNERECKWIINDKGWYSTKGPIDLFDILVKTFDLVKDYKDKVVYEEVCVLLHECIIQYLIGVDCVISNFDIEVEREFLIAIANNSLTLMELLNSLIESLAAIGVLPEKEIQEALMLKQIMKSLNMLSQGALQRFIDSFYDDIGKFFESCNFLELDMTKILLGTNQLFTQYNQYLNNMMMKKCSEEILTLNVFFYVKSLLTTAHKKVKNVEKLREKIQKDKNQLKETYEMVLGQNLTEDSLKILCDIVTLLEINSYMMSSSCITIREYIGNSFNINTMKALINLRCDFTSDDKEEAIAQCKEVLDKYVDLGNANEIGFFDKMEEEIKRENEFVNEESLEEIKSHSENNNNNKDNNNNIIVYTLEDVLKDYQDEDSEEEEQPQTTEVIVEKEEISIIVYEGMLKKKKHSKWQERYFQLKNGFLYWYKDKSSCIIQNKLSIAKTLSVKHYKDNKFFMVISEGKDENGNESGEIYKFECISEKEEHEWINAISSEMKRIKGEEEQSLKNIELKLKKKVIIDKYNLPEMNTMRKYMRNRMESLMSNEVYFKKVIKKGRSQKIKQTRISNRRSGSNSSKKSDNSSNKYIARVVLNLQEQVPEYSSNDDNASFCSKCLSSIFGLGKAEKTGVKEHLNQN